MNVYVVEMWVHGSDWASKVGADYIAVAKSFEAAKDALVNDEEWAVGKVIEFNLDTGAWVRSWYFEQSYYGKYDKTFVEEVEFDEIYSEYR